MRITFLIPENGKDVKFSQDVPVLPKISDMVWYKDHWYAVRDCYFKITTRTQNYNGAYVDENSTVFMVELKPWAIPAPVLKESGSGK